MNIYPYHLPTTGTVSFGDFCIDTPPQKTGTYASHISEATQTRANLRAVLKENKRTQHSDKDYLRLIKALDDYLPHLYGIMSSIASGTVSLRFEPVFSWRTTLSSQLLNNCPRVPLPSLHADLAFSLLTYGMALSNFARLTVNALGNYEHEPSISGIERHAKDEKLNFAVSLLCRASGVFAHLSESVLTDWNNAGPSGPRPPDLTAEVCAALSKMALADAQALAVRKLLSLSAYESTLSPGPPLPKSHPSTALLAKLHLECTSLYTSARSLALTPGNVRATRNAASESRIGVSGEITSELTRHLTDEAAFHSALAHKWLGVDAGESGVATKGGEVVGFLAWAKHELDDLCGSIKGTLLRKDRMSGEDRRAKKERVTRELENVKVFLLHYKKMNDSLTFQPVPKQSDLQTRIPAGRLAVSPKPYEPPFPAFGSTASARSLADTAKNSLVLDVPRQTASDTDSNSDDEPTRELPNRMKYTGAGSYF
ncbi:BRO1-like domain-containing protein [Pisolithus marmoratus]|nr:BRO1-like domain-containing protein [Pisolithus marmoratus]